MQIFWNGLMTEVMMTAFLMSAEPDDGAPLLTTNPHPEPYPYPSLNPNPNPNPNLNPRTRTRTRTLNLTPTLTLTLTRRAALAHPAHHPRRHWRGRLGGHGHA